MVSLSVIFLSIWHSFCPGFKSRCCLTFISSFDHKQQAPWCPSPLPCPALPCCSYGPGPLSQGSYEVVSDRKRCRRLLLILKFVPLLKKEKKKNPFFWCPPQLTQPPGRSPPRSVLPLGGHGGSQQPQMLDLNQNHARWIFQCYCFFSLPDILISEKKIVDLFISQVFRTFFCFTLFQSYVDRGHKGSCLLHLFSGL